MRIDAMPIIEVDNLSKVFRVNQKEPGLGGALKAVVRPRYVDKTAVAGISFTVEPGEVVGYIGVNGAGKSTTIKMLTGVLVPSGGQVRVFGRDPHRLVHRRDSSFSASRSRAMMRSAVFMVFSYFGS